jgi:O-antigen ligase
MSKSRVGDIILSFAAFFQIAVLMFKELLVAANIVDQDFFRMIGILLAALPMVPAIYYVIIRRLALSIGTYLIVIFIIASTLVLFNDNEKYLVSDPFNESGIFYLLFINVPTFLCLAAIRDLAYLKKVLLYISYLVFGLGLTYFYFLWIGKISYQEYSITFSYYLLLPALVFVKQRNLVYMFLFSLICIMMLILGSRGALVAAFFYVVFLFFIDHQSRNLLLPTVLVMVLLFGTFLTIYFTFAARTGVSSRTLEMLFRGTLTDSSGRMELYSATWNSVLDKPFIGHGIFGDRVILDGIYCHNIVLEMFHNFGLLLGAGLILFIVISSVRIWRKSNNENRKLLLLFFCYSIMPLLASTSYLQDPKFGIFIGSLFVLRNNIAID